MKGGKPTMKAKNVETGEELEFDTFEKDENAGEILK